MPDIKIWPKFPVVAEGWPSEQAVLRFYKEVINIYRQRGERGVAVATYIDTCVSYARGVAHLQPADREFLQAQLAVQQLQVSLGMEGDTELFSKINTACQLPERLLNKFPVGVEDSGMMTTFFVVARSCQSAITSRYLRVKKFSAEGMVPHPPLRFKTLGDAIENWDSLRQSLGMDAGSEEHQMNSFKVLTSNYAECAFKLQILQEVHAHGRVPIEAYVQSCARLAAMWASDSKTEAELAKLFPSAPEKPAKVMNVVSELPEELERRSDKGTCNVHLDNIEGCKRATCIFDHPTHLPDGREAKGSRAEAAICKDWIAGYCPLMGDCKYRHPTKSEMRHAEKKKERRHEKQSGKKNDNKLKAKFKRQTKILAATQKRVAELEDQLAATGKRRAARATTKKLLTPSSPQASPTATPSEANIKTTKKASKMPSPQGTKISGFLKPTKKNENPTTSDSKSLSAATRKLSSVKQRAQREKQPLLDSASSNSVQGKRNKATELEKPKRLKTKLRCEPSTL